MNYKMVGFVLGRIFLIEAALMLFPMGCAAIYGEWASIPAFLIPVLILLVLGLAASLISPKDTKIYARDGLAIVALVWVLLSVFGALPLSSPARSRPLWTPFLRWFRALRPPAPRF